MSLETEHSKTKDKQLLGAMILDAGKEDSETHAAALHLRAEGSQPQREGGIAIRGDAVTVEQLHIAEIPAERSRHELWSNQTEGTVVGRDGSQEQSGTHKVRIAFA